MHRNYRFPLNNIFKLILFYLAPGVLSLQTKAQDAIFSQTNHHQLFINPGYAGNSPYPRLMAGYRNQWPGLGKSFVSYYISYDRYFEQIFSNVGFILSRDVQGNRAISRTSGDLIYNYPVELSGNSIVCLGVQAGLVQKSINPSGMQLPDQTPYPDPNNPAPGNEVIPQRSKIFPDFSAGAAFYIKEQYLIGFAVHHINTPMETEGAEYNYNVTPMQITMQALAEISFNKPFRSVNDITLNPGIYAQLQKNFNFITWGANLRYNRILTGLWLRNNTSFSLNTLIVQLGYTTGATSFIYSYDAWVPLNNEQFKFYGAHEVTFIYHFKYNDPKKKMKTLKCPKI